MPQSETERDDGPTRFELIRGRVARSDRTFAQDVADGLTRSPKQLDPRWFYDHDGSLLFEQICELPEYYVTRAEDEILAQRAADIVERCDAGTVLVELGSGSSTKTRRLIDAFLARSRGLHYVPIDISETMLESASKDLLDEYPDLTVHAIAAEYGEGLERMHEFRDDPTLVLWLGSNVGNFDPGAARAFLTAARGTLRPGDHLLMGVDLRKDLAVLKAAYDDAAGVTAAFNKNVLARINRELDGAFDLDAFEHEAVWRDGSPGRIEMHLVSRTKQSVTIGQLDLTVTFGAGEIIHTESSYKYAPEEIDALAASAGFRVDGRWVDSESRFSANLMSPA